jgi:hypothetical protein
MSDEVRYVQNPSTASRVLGGQAVIVVNDRRQLHTLNATGTFLWDLLDEPHRERTLVEAVVAAYGVEEPAAGEDVRTFLDELERLGAIHRSPGA